MAMASSLARGVECRRRRRHLGEEAAYSLFIAVDAEGHRMSPPDMLVVIAAGNAGTAAAPKKSAAGFVDWLSISSPASCKNALTVGASRSDRSNGPLSSKTWGAIWPSNFPAAPIAAENVS